MRGLLLLGLSLGLVGHAFAEPGVVSVKDRKAMFENAGKDKDMGPRKDPIKLPTGEKKVVESMPSRSVAKPVEAHKSVVKPDVKPMAAPMAKPAAHADAHAHQSPMMDPAHVADVLKGSMGDLHKVFDRVKDAFSEDPEFQKRLKNITAAYGTADRVNQEMTYIDPQMKKAHEAFSKALKLAKMSVDDLKNEAVMKALLERYHGMAEEVGRTLRTIVQTSVPEYYNAEIKMQNERNFIAAHRNIDGKDLPMNARKDADFLHFKREHDVKMEKDLGAIENKYLAPLNAVLSKVAPPIKDTKKTPEEMNEMRAKYGLPLK